MAGVTTPPTEVGMEQIHPAFLSSALLNYEGSIREWNMRMGSAQGVIGRLYGPIREATEAHPAFLLDRHTTSLRCMGRMTMIRDEPSTEEGLMPTEQLVFAASFGLSRQFKPASQRTVGVVEKLVMTLPEGSPGSMRDHALIARKERGGTIIELSRDTVPVRPLDDLGRMGGETSAFAYGVDLRQEVRSFLSRVINVQVDEVITKKSYAPPYNHRKPKMPRV